LVVFWNLTHVQSYQEIQKQHGGRPALSFLALLAKSLHVDLLVKTTSNSIFSHLALHSLHARSMRASTVDGRRTDVQMDGPTDDDRPHGEAWVKCVPAASGAETYRGSGNLVRVVKM